MTDFVFLVSYPRSGNTWFRLLIANIQHPEELRTYHFIDRDKMVPDIHQHYTWEEMEKKEFDWSPIFVKSHFCFHPAYMMFPIIYIYRDVRDVAISYFHFHYRENAGLSFEEYLEKKFIPGKEPFGGWKEHINYWLIKENSLMFYPVKYEDFLINTKECLMEVFEFLNLHYEEKVIEEAIERTRFDRLKSIAEKDGVHRKILGLRGKSGGWKEVFSEKMLGKIWDYAGEEMEKLGYHQEG